MDRVTPESEEHKRIHMLKRFVEVLQWAEGIRADPKQPTIALQLAEELTKQTRTLLTIATTIQERPHDQQSQDIRDLDPAPITIEGP